MYKILILLVLCVGLMACSDGEVKLAPVVAQAIHDHDRCHLCGMMIKKYPGPKGEVFLKNNKMVPKFCSTRDMFNYALQPENQRQIDRLMVHDMGHTDWEHPDDSAFIDAKKAWYVYGTSKKAVMGPAVASFAEQSDAKEFAQSFGGVVLQYDQIDIGLLSGN
jgi:copper chaperone NosL